MRLDFPWCYLVHWAQDRKGWNRGSSLILRRIFVFSATWLVMSVQFYGAQDWRGGTKRHHIVLRLYLGEYLYSVLTTEYWWEILGATCLCKSLSRCFNNLWNFCSVGAVFTNSIYLLNTSTAEKISYLRSLMHNPPSPWVLAHVAWIPLACILSRPISCSSAMGQKRSPAWNSSIMKGSWPLFLLRKVGTLYSFIIKMFTSTIRILEMLLLGDVKSCFCALYRS